MDYFYYGTQFIICLLEIFLFCLWMNGFAKARKMKSIWKICAFLAAILLCYGTGLFLNDLPYEMIGCVFLFLLGIVLFQREPQTVLFYTFLYYVTEIAIEIMLMMLIGIIMPDKGLIVAIGRFNGMPFEALVKLLQFLVIFFTIKFSRPVKSYYGTRNYLLYCLPPISMFVLLVGINGFVRNFNRIENGGISLAEIFLILGSIGAVAVNTVVVYMIEEAARYAEDRKRIEMLLAKNELEKKHYEEIENMHRQYDIYLHDVRRMIRIIAAMVENGSWDNAGILADYMVDSIQDIRKNVLCFHDFLNALLVDRRSYAQSLDLSMTIEVKEPLIMGVIEEMDLVSLTGNLLDNAINAEKDAAQKEGIKCRIFTALDSRHIIVEVENSYDKDKEEKQSERKADKETEKIGNKHGIGLVSVQEILWKYGGFISRPEKPGRYFVKVVIPSVEKEDK